MDGRGAASLTDLALVIRESDQSSWMSRTLCRASLLPMRIGKYQAMTGQPSPPKPNGNEQAACMKL